MHGGNMWELMAEALFIRYIKAALLIEKLV